MNVIIVIMDTQRRDHLGCYGNKWIATPNIDDLAKESMVFDNACPESLPTLCVRRTLFTGMRTFPFTKRYYSSADSAEAAGSTFLGVPMAAMPGWEPIPWDQITLTETLAKSGYRTAMITDTAPMFMTPAMNYNRGFGHWDFIRGHQADSYGAPVLAEKIDLNRFVPSWWENSWEVPILKQYLANYVKRKHEEDYCAPRVFSAAIEWLEDNREAKDPFFLYVDSFDPHEPWLPPKKYLDMYDMDYMGIEIIQPPYGPTNLLSENEIKHMRALYAGSVTMVDTWFGKFISKVRELGLLDDTLFILTSDHGINLAEHGVSGKAPSDMYREVINVPFIIRHPENSSAGKRNDALVQHQDIFPTVINFLGVEPPYELDGKNLMPLVEGRERKVREHATCGFIKYVWATEGQYVLICNSVGEEARLFDISNDPEQSRNIAQDKPDVVKRMFNLVMLDANGGPILPDWDVSKLTKLMGRPE